MKGLSKAEFLANLAVLADDVKAERVRLNIRACADALEPIEGFPKIDREFHTMVFETMTQMMMEKPNILGVMSAAEHAWERYEILSKA